MITKSPFPSSFAARLCLALLAQAVACGGGGHGGMPGAGGTGADGDGTSVGGTGVGTGGDGRAAGGGTGVGGESGYVIPDGRGAALPFATYEAEDMETTGSLLGPSRIWTEVASEASGRKAVRLNAEGQYVQFTTAAISNAIVVRYSVPDGTESATLSVTIDGGAEKKLAVTSRFSWSYGDMTGQPPVFNLPAQNDPGQGHPHHFFDETRLYVVEGIPAGAVVQVKKSAGDTAANYDVDFVELEQVAPAIAEVPAGFVSLTACGTGATINDSSDDSAALQSCLNSNSNVFIPAGTFVLNGAIGVGSNKTIRGAGMWHSTFVGSKAHFRCTSGNCKYYDFGIFGETTARDDAAPDERAFDGQANSGVVLDHVWIEHRVVGYWTGAFDPEGSGGDGLLITGCRMRNLHADGVNFYGGMTNSVIEQSHFRNTGDDAIASWSDAARPVNSGNVYRHNTIQNTWMANGFGIYGGNGTSVEHNLVSDTIQLAGILVAQAFGSHAFGGINTFSHNTLLRDGGNYRDTKQGALKLEPRQGGLANVAFTDLDLVESTYHGVYVEGGDSDAFRLSGININGAQILSSGEFAIYLPAAARGSMNVDNVTVSGSGGGLYDDFNNQFSVVKGAGNVGF